MWFGLGILVGALIILVIGLDKPKPDKDSVARQEWQPSDEEGDYCIWCLENPKSPGSEYCSECIDDENHLKKK